MEKRQSFEQTVLEQLHTIMPKETKASIQPILQITLRKQAETGHGTNVNREAVEFLDESIDESS